ncbi:uncharacterized protein [Dermacentor albipictus]|uniref:uncharacterized protein n=1 Tax=Dermacentor albipictus TaxID=60249 RepID=UPI0038FC183D
MTLPATAQKSASDLNGPAPPETASGVSRMRWLIRLALFGAAALLATMYLTPDVTSPVAPPLRQFGTTECPTPPTPSAEPVPDQLNWRACPGEPDIAAEENFRLWDEKLVQGLRLHVQGSPRTEQESWHAITDHIHVFSAFLATTNEHAIHITSLVRSNETKANGAPIVHPPLVCIIRTSKTTIEFRAHIRLVWTYYNPSFRNALILCPPPKKAFLEDEDIRVAVATQHSRARSLRWLRLHRPPEKSPVKCCAVCVRPLYGSVGLWKVVEFIAHYRAVGATSFFFYDLNVTSDLKHLVSRMQSLGVDVTFIPFKLIMDTTGEVYHVHARGQMPALYDCIFRSLSKMEYHVHVDIDELMVPMPNFSMPAMVGEAERISAGSVGSVRVPCRYHCLEYPQNTQYTRRGLLPLQTRLSVYHHGNFSDDGVTKYIARSRTVCEAAVHEVLRHCARKTSSFLDSYKSYIRHYRQCCRFAESNYYAKLGQFWNITSLSVDTSFMELSARIERDPVVRTLMRVSMNSSCD